MSRTRPEVIYEDDTVLAINKPAGLLVHGDGKTDVPTLVDWIEDTYPDITGVGEDMKNEVGDIIRRPGVVHRIDKETSGVLLIAKTQKSFYHLKKQFQERRIQKEYRAIVWGVPKEGEGVIDAPIGRSAKDFRKKAVVSAGYKGGRKATTSYRVLERFQEMSYVAAYPKTGRTHQIRVHMAHMVHPIVCDSLYVPRRSCPEILGRLGLHAYSISFVTMDGMRLTISAGEPAEFELFLAELRRL